MNYNLYEAVRTEVLSAPVNDCDDKKGGFDPEQLVMYRIVQSPDEDEIGKTGTCTLKSLARWGEGFGQLEE